MIIWLSGPTGSGKTSLSDLLSKVGYGVVREEAPLHLFQAFSANPARHCEEVQEALMRARYSQWQRLPDKRKVVFDRSVDEDIFVFCRMHHASGYLEAAALSRLERLAADLKAVLPLPDLIVYLSVNEEELRRRMAIVGHPKPIVNSLGVQLSLYRQWISGRTESVVTVDNSQCRTETLVRAFSGE